MGQQGFTDEELEMLSEEERQAVLEGEAASEETQNSQENESEETSKDAEQSEGKSEGEAAAEADPETEEKIEEKPGGGKDESGKTPEIGNAQRPFVPVYQAESIEGIDEQLKALSKQLNEGEIDLEEFISQRDALREKQIEANLTQKFNQQSAEQLWNYERKLFFDQNPEYRDNKALNGALQFMFKELDTQENAGKSGLELLNEAKRLVDEQLGRSGGKPLTQPNQEPRQPAIEKTPPPKTLAHIPSAAGNETGRDEFSHLDGLDGVELERALSSLTPEQERRYLRGGV